MRLKQKETKPCLEFFFEKNMEKSKQNFWFVIV